MSEQLWQPSEQQLAKASIIAFRELVNKRFGITLSNYAALHQWSVENPEYFWSVVWDFCDIKASNKGESILSNGDKMPGAKWFPEARFNFAENLLWRNDDHTALIAICESGHRTELSYAELNRRVETFSAWLKSQGVCVGDRVAGYLPNLPEAIIAALATARIGAVWCSCSPDFGVNAVCDRFAQIEPVLLIATPAYRFNGKTVDRMESVRAMSEQIDSIRRVVIVPHAPADDHLTDTLDSKMCLWDAALSDAEGLAIPEYEQLAFDHPLYILFSSGTTGAPKCIIHGAGGTLLQHLKEHRLHVDLVPEDNLFFFTTCSWMMWNWLVSGLATGCTLTLYDGSPFYPKAHRLFRMVDETAITVLGVSAKVIAMWEKFDLRPAKRFDLSSLRMILSTGSPLLPNNFNYVYDGVKSDICLSSISGGTDIVSCFALGNPMLPVYCGELQCIGLGMAVSVRNDEGEAVIDEMGELCCDQPFPSMPIGFWNDTGDKRYSEAYFEKYKGIWSHGDYAKLVPHTDDQGNAYNGVIIYGRSDTTLNPGGVRIGTAEIYRQVDSLDSIKASLCIGQDWGGDQRVILFIVLQPGTIFDEAFEKHIRQTIRVNTSLRHVPAKIITVEDIPRTVNGKASELAVRDVVHGREVKNRHSLANPETLQYFVDLPELSD